jgi:hypothetical protein
VIRPHVAEHCARHGFPRTVNLALLINGV